MSHGLMEKYLCIRLTIIRSNSGLTEAKFARNCLYSSVYRPRYKFSPSEENPLTHRQLGNGCNIAWQPSLTYPQPTTSDLEYFPRCLRRGPNRKCVAAEVRSRILTRNSLPLISTTILELESKVSVQGRIRQKVGEFLLLTETSNMVLIFCVW